MVVQATCHESELPHAAKRRWHNVPHSGNFMWVAAQTMCSCTWRSLSSRESRLLLAHDDPLKEFFHAALVIGGLFSKGVRDQLSCMRLSSRSSIAVVCALLISTSTRHACVWASFGPFIGHIAAKTLFVWHGLHIRAYTCA